MAEGESTVRRAGVAHGADRVYAAAHLRRVGLTGLIVGLQLLNTLQLLVLALVAVMLVLGRTVRDTLTIRP